MKRHRLDRGELAGAVRRRAPFRPRSARVRLYDARGQPRAIDPATEPGRTLVARAEELIRLTAGRAA